jgi:hypothetical protein
MHKWLSIWAGHLWALGSLALVAVAVYFLWSSVHSVTREGTFVLGMAFILAGVLAFCAGAVAAYHWNTRVQRRGLRQGTIVVGRGSRQMPPGGVE